MEFVENEEALGLLGPAELDVVPPVPSEPFPFLKLPREIRDSIYYYALIRPLIPATWSTKGRARLHQPTGERKNLHVFSV